MNALRECSYSERCQVDTACYQAPRFQVHLDATGHAPRRPVRRHSEACTDHLGVMLQLMTRWANEHELTDGDLTVLIVNPPPGRRQLGHQPSQESTQTSGLIFTVIPLGASAEVAAYAP